MFWYSLASHTPHIVCGTCKNSLNNFFVNICNCFVPLIYYSDSVPFSNSYWLFKFKFVCTCTIKKLCALSDTNECLNLPCNQICTNTNGSFECTCRPGYVLLDDGRSCQGMYLSSVFMILCNLKYMISHRYWLDK